MVQEMNKVGIYHAIIGVDGYSRVGSFALDGTGRAVLEVVDENYRKKLEEFAAGVGPRSLKRAVVPGEGELYLKALCEVFERNSYWRVADESSPSS